MTNEKFNYNKLISLFTSPVTVTKANSLGEFFETLLHLASASS